MTTAASIKVERVRGISGHALYRDFVDARRTVIIEDACAHWAAHRHWSLDALEARFGDREVVLDGRTTTLGEILHAIRHSTAEVPAPYLRECYLPENAARADGRRQPASR